MCLFSHSSVPFFSLLPLLLWCYCRFFSPVSYFVCFMHKIQWARRDVLLCILCCVHATISMLTNVQLFPSFFRLHHNGTADTSHGSPIAAPQHCNFPSPKCIYAINVIYTQFHSILFAFSFQIYRERREKNWYKHWVE